MQKTRHRFWSRLTRLALVVVAALICNALFFSFVAPRIESARLDRTARVFLEKAGVGFTGLTRLDKGADNPFAKDSGLWRVDLPGDVQPHFDASRLPRMTGSERDKALRDLYARLPSPPQEQGLVGAIVWSGFSRVGKGTFCASRSCTITAARIGDTLFFYIANI